jgi:hypothetical protein
MKISKDTKYEASTPVNCKLRAVSLECDCIELLYSTEADQMMRSSITLDESETDMVLYKLSKSDADREVEVHTLLEELADFVYLLITSAESRARYLAAIRRLQILLGMNPQEEERERESSNSSER